MAVVSAAATCCADAFSIAERMNSNVSILASEACLSVAAPNAGASRSERAKKIAFEVKAKALKQTIKRHANRAPESEREKNVFFMMRPLLFSWMRLTALPIPPYPMQIVPLPRFGPADSQLSFCISTFFWIRRNDFYVHLTGFTARFVADMLEVGCLGLGKRPARICPHAPHYARLSTSVVARTIRWAFAGEIHSGPSQAQRLRWQRRRC